MARYGLVLKIFKSWYTGDRDPKVRPNKPEFTKVFGRLIGKQPDNKKKAFMGIAFNNNEDEAKNEPVNDLDQ